MLRHTRASKGLLSWQQEAGLHRESAYGRYSPVRRVFAIPDEVSDGEFATRLAHIVDREDALHLVGATLDGGGATSYRQSFPLPLRHLSCTAEELEHAARAAVAPPRNGGPWWEVAVIHGPDGRRYASCVFDHLVSDGYSVLLLQNELTGRGRRERSSAAGAYQEWVAWQRREFPRDGGGAGASRGFWLRHLDGTTADRPTPLPFTTDAAGGQPGLVTTMTRDLPLTFDDLRATAQVLRATPFLLVFANLIAAVSQLSGSEDITVRVAGTGRRPSMAGALGWFADAFPIRTRATGIADPHRALAVARPLTARILGTPATAPWEYIRALSSASDAGDAKRQIMLNFAPDETPQLFTEAEGEHTGPGSADALHLFVKSGPEGNCRLAALVDHGVFAPEGVRSFLDDVGHALATMARPRQRVESA
ncbi:hypothetical protein ACFYZ2_33250 [Streptomyces sviceus]|uniref:hypothetical protein n=1 Tax=Streptomyces sviceus TaxID=285530 RepID=UPI0036B4EDF6